MNYNVSIIIPIYNVAEYIYSSFISALNQSFQSIEYILVDDCGTDHSMAIINEILKDHVRRKDVFIYRHDKNRGLSAARNTGLEKATGEFVFFMDSDDEITLDCIEKHYNAIIKDKSDFTIADIKLVGSRSIHVRDFSRECEEIPLFVSFSRRMWSVSAWNKLYLKRFLQKKQLTFQEGLLHEDILWSYNLCLNTDKVSWVKEKTYIYKTRRGSITVSKNTPLKIESLIFILNKMIQDWENGAVNQEYKNEFAHMFNFYRFNTALLLLNFSDTMGKAWYYYNLLRNNFVTLFNNNSLYSRILNLPFPLFLIFIYPFYSVYKILSK